MKGSGSTWSSTAMRPFGRAALAAGADRVHQRLDILVRRELVARPDGARAAEQAPAVAAGGEVGEQAFRLHRHGEPLRLVVSTMRM